MMIKLMMMTMMMMVVMMMVVMVVVMVVVDQDNGGHGNMSPGQLSQVAGGRPLTLTHCVSGQLVHDRGHRWTSENIGGQKCLSVEFTG